MSEKEAVDMEEKADTPSLAAVQGTKVLATQVGGHRYGKNGNKVGMLDRGNGIVLKALQAPPRGTRELWLYQTTFAPTCQDKDLLELCNFLPLYYGTEVIDDVTFLVMNNIAHSFTKPNVLDMKMGMVTYDPEASEEKRRHEVSKYPPLKELGFQLTGMMMHDSLGCPKHFTKDYCRSVTAETMLTDGVGKFFGLQDGRLRREVVETVLTRLRRIERWFQVQRIFAFYASSLLVVYSSQENGAALVTSASHPPQVSSPPPQVSSPPPQVSSPPPQASIPVTAHSNSGAVQGPLSAGPSPGPALSAGRVGENAGSDSAEGTGTGGGRESCATGTGVGRESSTTGTGGGRESCATGSTQDQSDVVGWGTSGGKLGAGQKRGLGEQGEEQSASCCKVARVEAAENNVKGGVEKAETSENKGQSVSLESKESPVDSLPTQHCSTGSVEGKVHTGVSEHTEVPQTCSTNRGCGTSQGKEGTASCGGRLSGKTEGLRTCRSDPPVVEVRMIDFAHVFPASGKDSNYLFGLHRLIAMLEQLLEM